MHYLRTLEEELAGVDPEERGAILAEIRSHLAEASSAGRRIPELLETLGPARELARGYELELALNRRGSWLDRAFRVIGVLATATLPSMVIVPVLGSVGVARTGAGFIAFGAAALSPLLPPDLLPPDFRADVALVWGLPLAAGGLAALTLLWIYLSFLRSILLQVLRNRGIALEPSMLPAWLRRAFYRFHARRA